MRTDGMGHLHPRRRRNPLPPRVATPIPALLVMQGGVSSPRQPVPRHQRKPSGQAARAMAVWADGRWRG
jgi:hypothetical protein